jgi:protein Tex
LSKDALAGNVPLRTFGQLKQLWEARTEGPDELAVKAMGSLEPGALDQTPQPASQPPSEEKPVVPAATASPADDPQNTATPLETSDG